MLAAPVFIGDQEFNSFLSKQYSSGELVCAVFKFLKYFNLIESVPDNGY